jgi:prepilin-type N-terminal cleavage/methylation domain-containing protein
MLKAQRGFTLIEIGVALALIGLMAAVLAPQVINRLRESESGSLITNLAGVEEGVASYRADIGRYPRRLSNLTTAITTGQKDLCGVNVPDITAWQGPYLNRAVISTGIPVGSATVRDSLHRDPPISTGLVTTALGSLLVTVLDVDLVAANSVDATLDGDGSLTGTGAITWTALAPSTDRGTLVYRIPIRGC